MLEQIKLALQAGLNQESPNHLHGICYALTETNELAWRVHDRMLHHVHEQGWYSGTTTFPIDPEDSKGDPDLAMKAYFDVTNLWNPSTVYGQRRRIIAELLIKDIDDGYFR